MFSPLDPVAHYSARKFPNTMPYCLQILSLRLQSTAVPELPDISAYLTALEFRVLNQPLVRVRLASAFLLRTVQPPLADAEGHTMRELRRVGKRLAFGLDNDLWLVLHLMIAGRLHWRAPQAKLATL